MSENRPINPMTPRMCSFCLEGYLDCEGHDYKRCLRRLLSRRDLLLDRLTEMTGNIREVRNILENREEENCCRRGTEQ